MFAVFWSCILQLYLAAEMIAVKNTAIGPKKHKIIDLFSDTCLSPTPAPEVGKPKSLQLPAFITTTFHHVCFRHSSLVPRLRWLPPPSHWGQHQSMGAVVASSRGRVVDSGHSSLAGCANDGNVKGKRIALLRYRLLPILPWAGRSSPSADSIRQARWHGTVVGVIVRLWNCL